MEWLSEGTDRFIRGFVFGIVWKNTAFEMHKGHINLEMDFHKPVWEIVPMGMAKNEIRRNRLNSLQHLHQVISEGFAQRDGFSGHGHMAYGHFIHMLNVNNIGAVNAYKVPLW